jgi:hypothetical protein
MTDRDEQDRRSPLALFQPVSWETDNDCIMTCPVCGFDYTHPVGAYTRLGSDTFEAGVYDGTRALDVTGYRRSALVVRFYCEGGCRFALVVQQHKGQNFVWVEVLPDDPRYGSDDDSEFDPLASADELARLDARIRLLQHKRERLARTQQQAEESQADFCLQRCRTWLREQLANGPMPVSELRKQAETALFPLHTVYRAREAVGVREFKQESKTWWELTSKTGEP